MARLDIVKKREAELRAAGMPEAEIAAELEKIESPIAWRILHHFDPVNYPKEMPQGFKAVSVNAGNMSYGFNITMPDGVKIFLKAEKMPNPEEKGSFATAAVVQKYSLNPQEPLAEFAEYLADNGVVTARPIRSGNNNFIKDLPQDDELPPQLKGSKVSLFQALSGSSTGFSKTTHLRSFAIQAAQSVGQFQRYGTEFFAGKVVPALEIDDFSVTDKLEKLPGKIRQFLEDIDFPGHDLSDLAKNLRNGNADFSQLIERNSLYILQELMALGKASDGTSNDIIEQLASIKKAYVAKAFHMFPILLSERAKFIESEEKRFLAEQKNEPSPKTRPDKPFEIQFIEREFFNLLRKLPSDIKEPEQLAFIKQGLKILYLERVQELSTKAIDGTLGKYVCALALVNERYAELRDLPKGIIHNDAHLDNVMEHKNRAAIIDFGATTKNGVLLKDIFAVMTSSLRIKQNLQKPSDITIPKDDIKPMLAEYDAARSYSDGLPRLSQSEANNIFLFELPFVINQLLDQAHEVVNLREHFSEEYRQKSVNLRRSLLWMDDVTKHINSVVDKPVGQWLQETRAEALEALDLATFVIPARSETLLKPSELKTFEEVLGVTLSSLQAVCSKPSQSVQLAVMCTPVRESKEKKSPKQEEKDSWVNVATPERKPGFNVTPRGSREI